MKNLVKSKLAAHETPVGTMVLEFNTTGIARLAASAGADWILFDMEHTGWSTNEIRTAIAIARGVGIVPMVRPQSLSYHHCSVLLDIGAMGVMAPMVQSVEQAELLVSSCRYPPKGRRGSAFGIAHDDYLPGDQAAKMASADEEIMTIAMIETVDGVENVESIAGVEGLDALWVGHFDLSAFLGIPGQFSHPKFLDAISRVLEAAGRRDKPVGRLVSSADEAATSLDQGFAFLLFGPDFTIYRDALMTGIRSVRDLVARPGGT